MYYHKVEICGVNTAKLPVLKEKEKMELIVKAQAGDKEARQKMINGNLRLVLSVVQKFTGRGENLDDLFQVGCIGLIKAIDNFNPGLGLRFSTYGQPMIIGEIRRFLRDNNAMRVSRSVRDVAYKAMQARELLQKKLGREPNVREISEAVGLPQATVTLALESVVEPVSLYEPVYSDGGDTIYVMDQWARQAVRKIGSPPSSSATPSASCRTERKKIMSLRYLAGKNAGRGCGGDRYQPGAGEPSGKKTRWERIKKQL